MVLVFIMIYHLLKISISWYVSLSSTNPVQYSGSWAKDAILEVTNMISSGNLLMINSMIC